ncbi:sensor domain-containing diguanylate cyclase [Spirochaeta isovalerica]|uniref:diguanylate cyclase n=1 Tax=Spirochaeta isovalerica TaxID=150 RepID=A0A841RF14_9SPIO|nr:diguanylate cyclase [Spirochaeta isovalerica]MBB6481590.1 diguanylate cyclase (GGDEF)-like protein/PAS domain S-box-containing protein [Spirochaeta isovalerica]
MIDKNSIFSDIYLKLSLHDRKSILLMGETPFFEPENKKKLTSFIHPDDRKAFSDELEAALDKAEPFFRLSDFKLRDRKGDTKHVSIRGRLGDGYCELFFNDVSAYYRKMESHNDLINRYEQLLLTLKEAVWEWDLTDDSVVYSDRWYEMLALSANEIEDTFEFWKKLVHPDDLEKTIKALNDHISGKTDIYECTYRMKRSDGTWIWVRDRGKKQLDNHGSARRMIGSHRDITGEKSVRENLEKMIITDELTSLFNRRHYDARIRDEILRAERYGSKLSILMIDIDLFKQINDTYGHRAGDIALKELAKTIKGKIRNTDSAYRTGGEEFVVIAPLTDENSAMKAAERLRKAVSEIRVDTGFGSFSFTISLGITTHTKGDTYSSLNERADVALYLSKESGRNCATQKLP